MYNQQLPVQGRSGEVEVQGLQEAVLPPAASLPLWREAVQCSVIVYQ